MTESGDKTYLIYTLLKEVFLFLDHGDRNLFQEFDLSVAQFNALMQIINSTGIGPSELGSKMLCDKANITRLLDGMEKKSYIERIQDETDGRRLQIIVKPEGEMLWRKARDEHGKSIRRRLEVLTSEEQDTLSGWLMRIRNQLQNQLMEGSAHRPGSVLKNLDRSRQPIESKRHPSQN